MGKQRDARGRRAAEQKEAKEGAGAGSPSLALLWGWRDRPARGPKPALSLDAVVQAAIDVADADGLGALTMTRVAERLDVTPMALYRYVPGKDELMDLMNDVALGPPPLPSGGEWRAETVRWARASLARFQAKPWLIESVRRVAIGPNWLGWLDAGLRALSGSGLAAGEMLPAVMLVDGHVRATAQLSASTAGTERWAQDFRRVLQTVLGDSRFPGLSQLVEAGGLGRPSAGAESPFEFGLQRILDGLERRPAPKKSRRR